MKPTTAQRFGGRFGIAVITGKDGGTATANFSDFTRLDRLKSIVQDRDFHPHAWPAAGANVGVWIRILRTVHLAGQDGDVTGDLSQPKVLHQYITEFLQGQFLICPIHRRPGINHELQAAVIIFIHGRMFDQHFDDRRHGEHIGHTVTFHRLPKLSRVKLFAGHQHCRRTTRDVQ